MVRACGTHVNNFRVEEAREEDIPDIMSILVPSFSHIPMEKLLGNVDTPEGRRACGQRHVQAWHEHGAEFVMPCAIKCIHTDPGTGKETLVGFAEWFIYDKPRTAEQYTKQALLLSASWVPTENGEQARAKQWLQPLIEKRMQWMGGRRFAVLMYMCVDKQWRRKGASTMCVQWGLDRCREMNLPAYLEASADGEPVYKRLGFGEVEKVKIDFEGTQSAFPAMIWWPPGTKDEDKKPAL